VKLGFLLKAMRGPIERAVHQELDSLFARHTAAPAKKPAAPKAAPSPKKATGARKKGG
jgi:hypothetical protein